MEAPPRIHGLRYNGYKNKVRCAKPLEGCSIGGQGHGPAEDSGGTEGWMELKEAFEHPRKKGNQVLVEWYKEVCANGDPKRLEPYEWDVREVNEGLNAIFPASGTRIWTTELGLMLRIFVLTVCDRSSMGWIKQSLLKR